MKAWELRATAWKETAASQFWAMHLESHCFWRRKMQSWMRAQPGTHLYERVQERSTLPWQWSGGPAPTKTRVPLLSYDLKVHEMTFPLLNKIGPYRCHLDVILYWILEFPKHRRWGKEGGRYFSEATWFWLLLCRKTMDCLPATQVINPRVLNR